jgi:hypothetical protein
MMWSRPRFTSRRGTVAGTRKVRKSKPPAPRDRIERLGKVRGAVVDALVAAGGALTLAQLCEVLHRSRARDLRRRILTMLEHAGIIKVAGDVVSLAPDWSERLEDARWIGGEIEADKLAEERRKAKSRAYRERGKVKPTPHWTNAGADGHIEDLRPAHTPEENAAQDAHVSPLSAAIRSYLERSPADACQPPGWIGSTLWAYDLCSEKPTPAECRAAIEELGGDTYLRDRLAGGAAGAA